MVEIYNSLAEALEKLLPTDTPLELFFCYTVGFVAIWWIYSSDYKRHQHQIYAAKWALIAPGIVTVWCLWFGGDPKHISFLEMSTAWIAYLSVIGAKWTTAVRAS